MQFLEDLEIEEVSLVSRDWAPGPANKHARILFSKTAKESESEMPCQSRMSEILSVEEVIKTGDMQPDQESAMSMLEELAGEIRKMAQARGVRMTVEKSIFEACEEAPNLYMASCSR